ncbi:stage II sporulation protein R [Halalkalibacillus sediminis]|uniref:Stage II sporulation protein R n=1 Tax=Halalkalibacillus sediminis TaxID=2018042 RepID=A0A2I0QTR5_9BACI|nr:stage II sporulation protein R [Halalkalibacillus sediminis]PKR77731.1 stage II sporulation protein R [Halalkalibacillus sediminis]
MKYTIAIILLLIIFQVAYTETVAEPQDDYQVIPDEAIRLRILANSNSDEDQTIKRQVRDDVNEQITEWVEELTSIEDARSIIQTRLGEIEAIAQATAGQQAVSVSYGPVEFPSKVYDTFVYPGGTYEAVLIEIGDGLGDNWWCVLFPPLCFVDFADGTTVLDHDEEEQDEEPEVKFFLWEWLKKIFGALNGD